MNRYLVGTEDGLRSIRAVNGAWETEATATLKGKKVLCGQRFGTRVVTTCYGDGMHIPTMTVLRGGKFRTSA
jgi:hypothetical protein